MKRLLLLITLSLTAPPALAWQVIGSGVVLTTDYCSGKLGSYSFYYDVDHPDGTTTACKTSGTSVVTLSTSTAEASSNTTPGGTYGILHANSQDTYIRITADDSGLTPQSGRVEWKIKMPETMPAAQFAIFEYGTSEAGVWGKMQYSATGAGGNPGFRLLVSHSDGSKINPTTGYVESTSLAGQVVTCTADWSSTTGLVIITMTGANGGSASGTVSDFELPAYLYYGESVQNISASGMSVDDIKTGPSQQ